MVSSIGICSTSMVAPPPSSEAASSGGGDSSVPHAVKNRGNASNAAARAVRSFGARAGRGNMIIRSSES